MWSLFSRDPVKDFHYDIGQPLGVDSNSVWCLCTGRRKSSLTTNANSNDEITIFVFDKTKNSAQNLELARAAVKRMKTLRHPSLLMYIDSVETDKVIYVATEKVNGPLGALSATLNALEGNQKTMFISWGLFQITRAINFLQKDCQLFHNNICSWSVFLNNAGEWKLGGFEYVSADALPVTSKVPHSLEVYNDPDKRTSSDAKHASDMWGLGCLLWECFNGPLRSRTDLKQTNQIPKNMMALYTKLCAVDASSRPRPIDIVNRGRQANSFFNNSLIDTLVFLEELQIKDQNEKTKFFANLTNILDQFHPDICRYKILPQLVTAHEFGNVGSSILAPMFKLGRLLSDAEYQTKIVPCIVKLFASTDRVTRSRLLLQMETFVPHLQPNVVNDQIFPQVAHGFMDTNPTIREQTVKAIIHLAPKLNYNNLNTEVLRHFARLQSRDDQGGIRTNTTICLGKIATFIHPEVRQRVLISAFVRALRDPFPPSRIAGIMALAATQQYYMISDVATKILPHLFPLTIDVEKTVREPAFKTIKGFLGKLERVSENPALKEELEADVGAATPTLSNATSTWTGWAVSAVTSKFYRSRINEGPIKESNAEPSDSNSIKSNATSNATLSTHSSENAKENLARTHSDDGGDDEEDNDGGNDWNSENWGDMDTDTANATQTKNSFPAGSTTTSANLNVQKPIITDGWDDNDDDDWDNLVTTPKAESIAVARKPAATLQMKNTVTDADSWGDSWANDEIVPEAKPADEARLKREAKKQQRLKELEAKRATRGPMKLGVSQKDKLFLD